MTAKNYLLYIFLLIGLITIGCEEEDENPPKKSNEVNINGYVQKGPYINGTSITIYELDENLAGTGKNFNTQITDNKGTFEIKGIELSSSFVQLRADGFYFDEVKGEKSVAQLTLYALADITVENSVNVNLLSHLEKDRVIFLIENGKSFSEAKKQAQKEILEIFGIGKDDMANSETLDISQEGEDNAILLAISAVLQGNNTVAELSEILANINTDLKEDGILNSETIKIQLVEQAKGLNLSEIRNFIEKRYDELGVDATIANFEKYIDSDGDGILNKDEDDTPEDIIFETQIDVAVNTPITSNEVVITGLAEDGFAPVILKGGGSILKNGEQLEDSITTVQNGDKLQLRVTSSAEYDKEVIITLAVGSLISTFEVITDDYIPASFEFTSKKDVAVSTYYTSNTITIAGLPHPTPVNLENGVLIKNGVEMQDSEITVVNGDQLSVKLKASNEYNTSTTATLDINTITASFEITTDNYAPDDFSFTTKEMAMKSTEYTSDTVTMSGLLYPTPVKISDGILIKNNIYLNSDTTTVVNGDQLQIKLTSHAEWANQVETNLQIGSITKTYIVINRNNQWIRKAYYPGSYSQGQVSFVIGGKVYLGLGIPFSKEFYSYDPALDKWTKVADFGGEARTFAVAFTLNGKGYVGLGNGSDSNEFYKDFWEYDPATNKWTRIADFGGEARYWATCFTINGFAYVGTGSKANINIYFQDFWKYNPSVNSWTKVTDFKGGKRFVSTSFSLNGKGYLVAGRDQTWNLKKDVWEYNPTSNIWNRKKDFPGGNDSSGISFIINDKVYFAMGDPNSLRSDNFYEYDSINDSWIFLDGFYNQNGIGITVNGRGFYLKSKDFWEYIP